VLSKRRQREAAPTDELAAKGLAVLGMDLFASAPEG
jgi:hypothetical protein